ncbi:hypothetical protein C5167_047899 [Papaver somniferum]|uniref:Uncharacterized protein n=1 Tax=Papaver somniferum TaxID=3469 RepID=A0A4Y7LIS1_PAPSO|nr:hypothetical protein C5167_047899 [Papaver somniferum]
MPLSTRELYHELSTLDRLDQNSPFNINDFLKNVNFPRTCIFNAGLGCVKSLHILTSSHLRIEPMEVFVAPVFKRLAEKKFHAVTLVVSCQ